jgi:hypothetical protein
MSDYTGNFLVYFNGVEIPSQDVIVEGGIWTIPTATINLAPHRVMSRFGAEDRIQVAIFYLDEYYDPNVHTFKLLFEGEIAGWQYVKQQEARLLQFHAISHIAIFTQLFLYYIGNKSADNYYSGTRYESSNPSVIKVSTFYPSSFFYQGIVGHKLIKRPFDFLENILGAILGSATYKQKTQVVYDKSKAMKEEVTKDFYAFLGDLSKQTIDASITTYQALEDLHVAAGQQFAAVATGDTKSPQTSQSNVTNTPSSGSVFSSTSTALTGKYGGEEIQEQAKQKKRSTVKRSVVVTNFFLRWMRLTKFADHFIASPYFEDSNLVENKEGIFPILRALNAKEGVDALIKITGAKSGAQSVWNMIVGAFGQVFYEVCMIAAPPAVIVNRDALPISNIPFDLVHNSQDNIDGKFKEMAKNNERMRIASFITKPMSLFGVPPSCNVFFPIMYTNFNYSETYSKQLTRLYMSRSKNPKSYGPAGLVSNIKGLKVAFPREIDVQTQKKGLNAVDSEHNHLMWPEEYFRGPVIDSRQFPEYLKNIAAKTIINKKRSKTVDEENIDKIEDDNTVVADRAVPGVPLELQAELIDSVQETVKQQQDIADKMAFKETLGEIHQQTIQASTAETIKTNAKKKDFHLDDNQANEMAYTAIDAQQAVANAGSTKATGPNGLIQKSRELRAKGVSKELADQVLTESSILATDAEKETEKTKKHLKKTISKQALHQLYYDYARQEFYREKYQHRAMDIQTLFNPYPIAGLPCYVFDDPAVGIHVVGVITSWTHTLSNSDATGSSFNISFCRTLDEFFEDVVKDGLGLESSPAEAIPEIRKVMQKFKNARKYYARLLYQNTEIKSELYNEVSPDQIKDPIADFTKLLMWASKVDTVREEYEGVPIVSDPSDADYNMQSGRDVIAWQPGLFKSLKHAFAYVARPVCTLQEYITFYKGIRYAPFSQTDGLDSVYYAIIRKFKGWDGVSGDPVENDIDVNDLPDSRRDWQKTLLYYRDQITGNKIQNFSL